MCSTMVETPLGDTPSAPSSPSPIRSTPSPLTDIMSCPPPDTTSATQDVFETIVKGRKSWKTSRGGEPVWPPELEAALLEGLEKYQPDDSRETRLLGRFPLRNRFISDYIYNKTGKRRTAKQVGSRLQQLRDTCGGKRLLNLLSPCRRQVGPGASRTEAFLREIPGPALRGLPSLHCDSDSSSEASASSAPSTPTDSLFPRGDDWAGSVPAPSTIVYIDLLHEGAAESPSKPPKADPEGANTSPHQHHRTEGGPNVIHASPQPRCLRNIDPTLTFVAHATILAQSHFVVHMDKTLVFSESTPLVAIGPSPEDPTGFMVLYSTSLVPGFWKTIMHSPDPTLYTITQQVVRESAESAPSTMFSAVYKFQYPGIKKECPVAVRSEVPSLAAPSCNPLEFPFDDLFQMNPEYPEILDGASIDGYSGLPMGAAQKGHWLQHPIAPASTFDANFASPHDYEDDSDASIFSPTVPSFSPDFPNYVM